MADQGALYAGMNYSTKVEPVDFGGLALGFAKISEDKRLESERKQKEKEDFQVEMNKLYGEEIYTAFDNTGIENIDIIGGKLKDGIVAHSETLNKLYTENKISKPELQARMNKLKSQSAKYNGFITQLGDYADKVQSLGSDASEATRLILQRMDELVKNATPVVDSEGNISFLSKSGEVITQTPFSQLDRIMDFRKQVDEKSIIDGMVNTEGALSKLFEKGAIKSTYLENGRLKEAHRTLLSRYTSTLDDTDLYDIASRAGIDVELSPKDVLKITNKDAVKAGVNQYLEKLALGEYQRKESLDYAEYTTVMDRHNLTKTQIGKALQEDQSYVKNTLPASDNKLQRSQYVLLKPQKVANLQGMMTDLMKVFPASATPGIDFNTAEVSDYQEDGKGGHYATITYVREIPQKSITGEPVDPIKIVDSQTVQMTSPEVIGRVRAVTGLPTNVGDVKGLGEKVVIPGF